MADSKTKVSVDPMPMSDLSTPKEPVKGAKEKAGLKRYDKVRNKQGIFPDNAEVLDVFKNKEGVICCAIQRDNGGMYVYPEKDLEVVPK